MKESFICPLASSIHFHPGQHHDREHSTEKIQEHHFCINSAFT